MKKYFLIPALFLTMLFDAKAQIEITPFTGYAFDHSFPIAGGRARLGGGQTFGGMLGYRIRDNSEVELSYSYQGGTITASSSLLSENFRGESEIHYAMIGFNRLFPVSDKVEVFGGLKFGSVTLAARNNDFNNVTRVAAGIQGGMKYFISDKVGIRIQTNLMMPITNVGASLWWSSGGGPQVGVSSFSSIVQFGFTGGLVIRINKS